MVADPEQGRAADRSADDSGWSGQRDRQLGVDDRTQGWLRCDIRHRRSGAVKALMDEPVRSSSGGHANRVHLSTSCCRSAAAAGPTIAIVISTPTAKISHDLSSPASASARRSSHAARSRRSARRWSAASQPREVDEKKCICCAHAHPPTPADADQRPRHSKFADLGRRQGNARGKPTFMKMVASIRTTRRAGPRCRRVVKILYTCKADARARGTPAGDWVETHRLARIHRSANCRSPGST